MARCWMMTSWQTLRSRTPSRTRAACTGSFKILNTDRATFGRVGGAVAKLHGDSGFAGTLSFDLEVRLVDPSAPKSPVIIMALNPRLTPQLSCEDPEDAEPRMHAHP